MLVALSILALGNHAPAVQQQTRLSMSRIAGAPQPAEDLVQQLRGGGAPCDVILVGCGVPKRGMGWYHGKQMLEGLCPSASLTTIVEPYFLGPGAESPPGQTFNAWADEMAAKYGTKFAKSVQEVEIKGPTLALISGRTADNPKLLREVIDAGFSHVYLEKPGAPTVGELQEMKAYAEAKGVGVMMGYNKNVTKYVTLAREFEAKTKGASTTLDRKSVV